MGHWHLFELTSQGSVGKHMLLMWPTTKTVWSSKSPLHQSSICINLEFILLVACPLMTAKQLHLITPHPSPLDCHGIWTAPSQGRRFGPCHAAMSKDTAAESL